MRFVVAAALMTAAVSAHAAHCVVLLHGLGRKSGHTFMVYSPSVVEAVKIFLRDGVFAAPF